MKIKLFSSLHDRLAHLSFRGGIDEKKTVKGESLKRMWQLNRANGYQLTLFQIKNNTKASFCIMECSRLK